VKAKRLLRFSKETLASSLMDDFSKKDPLSDLSPFLSLSPYLLLLSLSQKSQRIILRTL